MRSEVQVLLDPPRIPFGDFGGVSSAGRAPALQAGGHRFDPDTLHQLHSCLSSDSTVRPLSACERSAVQLDADFGPVLHRLERYNIRTEAPRVRGLPDGTRPAWACDSSKICFVQVKYTNRSESNLTRTKSCCEPAARFGNVCILIKATL